MLVVLFCVFGFVGFDDVPYLGWWVDVAGLLSLVGYSCGYLFYVWVWLRFNVGFYCKYFAVSLVCLGG